MSSLAATQSDGFYFPPNYDGRRDGGLSKFNTNGQYKGSNQYQQSGIIRFELPFDAWCLQCEAHLSKGLRFNAKKDIKKKCASPPLSCTLTQSAPASLIIIPAQFAHRYYFSAVGRLSGDGCPPLSFALCLTNQSAAPASLIIIRPQAIAPRMISTRSLLPAFPCTLLTIL